MSSGHFNAGNVWGKIKEAKQGATKDKHTPFLDLEIDCSNSALGNGRAFGRMWGKEKIDALTALLADKKDTFFRLKGFYEQYEDHHGTRFSSYTFYDFVPTIMESGTGRAAFILVGDLTKKELIAGEGVITLAVGRPGKEEQSLLILYLLDVMPYYEIEEGDLLEVRGALRKREPEDFYGGSSDDPIRPYVMTVKKRERK